MRGIFHPSRWAGAIGQAEEKVYKVIFLYFLPYYLCYKLHFGIKMCTIKFSIKLNTFQIDDKDLTTNNICKKSE